MIMKNRFFVALCLLAAAFISHAQINNGVKRTIIARLDNGTHVNNSEFIYNYYGDNNHPDKNDYVAVLRNRYDDIIGFLHNDTLIKIPTIEGVVAVKIGFDNIYAVINKSKAFVNLNLNNTIIKHDTIADLFEDGYVYGSSRRFYYRQAYANDSKNDILVYYVPQKTTMFKETDVSVKFANQKQIIHLNIGHEVFKATEDHCYYFYQTALMEKAIIVVDGNGFVLDGNHNNLRFKYSANSRNWIACCDDYLLVNGAKFQIKGKSIRDFFINDDGDFAYILDYKTADKNTSDLCINGKTLLKNVEIYTLQLMNTTDWIYRFKKDGKLYEGNGYVYKDYTNSSFYFYRDDSLGFNDDFMLKSNDDRHEFVSAGVNVTIDGHKIESNKPYSVFWDNNKKSFVWITCENNEFYLNTYNVIQ